MRTIRDLGYRTLFAWSVPVRDKGATEGNHRLTALTGSVLAPLLALIFLTGLFMDAWWHLHYVVGFVLIPIVVLKMASTGYRMIRYYTGNPTYRAAGPPDLVSRLLAPLMVVSVVTALATGVLLFAEHSRRGVLSTLHTDAAIATAALVGIHLLTYIPDAVTTISRDFQRLPLTRLATLRLATAASLLIVGIALAIVTFNRGTWPARDHRRSGAGLVQGGGRLYQWNIATRSCAYSGQAERT
jgi:hypothetical protein